MDFKSLTLDKPTLAKLKGSNPLYVNAMEYFAEHGGTASALLGATQYSVAGLISAASALLPETVLAVILAQGGCSLLCLVLAWSQRSVTTTKLL